jgi:hypothetical protein
MYDTAIIHKYILFCAQSCSPYTPSSLLAVLCRFRPRSLLRRTTRMARSQVRKRLSSPSRRCHHSASNTTSLRVTSDHPPTALPSVPKPETVTAGKDIVDHADAHAATFPPSTEFSGAKEPNASKAKIDRPSCSCSTSGRNLVVCIDGTSNQFSKNVRRANCPLTSRSLMSPLPAAELQCRRALQSPH